MRRHISTQKLTLARWLHPTTLASIISRLHPRPRRLSLSTQALAAASHHTSAVAGPRRPILTTMPEMQQRASLISSSAAANSTSIDAQAEDPHSPTSIPPWVHVNDATTDDAHLISSPSRARPNTRHYKPPPAHYKPGRKWDHLRSPSPPLLTAPITEHQVRWRPFVYSGPNPREQHDGARVVSQAWMEEHMPALSQGWREEDEQRAEGEFQGWGGGLMYKGKWLISPERQERTVRLFWVSRSLSISRDCALEVAAYTPDRCCNGHCMLSRKQYPPDRSIGALVGRPVATSKVVRSCWSWALRICPLTELEARLAQEWCFGTVLEVAP